MRPALSLLLVITSLQLIAQPNSAGTRIDLNTASNLAASKPTLHDVIAKLGEPADELIKFDNALLTYKVDQKVYTFRFDENKRLNNFIFSSKDDKLPDHLSYSDVKQARNLKTKAEILHKLGDPTQVVVNQEKEVWFYQVGEQTSPKKTLIIHFDPAAPANVQDYKFYASTDNAAVISADVTSSFIKGTTTAAEIESKLGKPSQIILSAESENWYYNSKNTTLIVYFDNQSKINDFVYKRSAGETDHSK